MAILGESLGWRKQFTHKGKGGRGGGGGGGGAVCPFPGFATAYYSNHVRIDIVKLKELSISSGS